MFTCSSCGYEANPDSAPACSLCGTKRPAKAGSSRSEADNPKPAEPAPSAAGSGTAKGSATAKKKDDSVDELALAAQTVVDSTADEAKVSTKGARSGRPAEGGRAVVTAQGILRMSAPPPLIENATLVLGAFVGTLAGYVLSWHRIAHAPASLQDLVLPAVGAIVVALIARLLVVPTLETALSFKAKETLQGPIAGACGVAFAILALVGFFEASYVSGPTAVGQQGAPTVVGAPGDLLAVRIALLTPWTVSLRTEKFVVFTLKGAKSGLRVPTTGLTAEDAQLIAKATGLSTAELAKLVSSEPGPDAAAPLPPAFSTEVFLDRLASVYLVQVDATPRTNETRHGTLLVRRRQSREELLSLPLSPTVVGDLASALPQGVPLWIGVSLGIARDSIPADHEALVGNVYEKFRGAD